MYIEVAICCEKCGQKWYGLAGYDIDVTIDKLKSAALAAGHKCKKPEPIWARENIQPEFSR